MVNQKLIKVSPQVYNELLNLPGKSFSDKIASLLKSAEPVPMPEIDPDAIYRAIKPKIAIQIDLAIQDGLDRRKF